MFIHSYSTGVQVIQHALEISHSAHWLRAILGLEKICLGSFQHAQTLCHMLLTSISQSEFNCDEKQEDSLG